MSIRELKSVLAKITYKPGWDIGFDDGDGMVLLYAQKSRSLNAYRGRKFFQVGGISSWVHPRNLTATLVIKKIHRMIRVAESHEVGEWFKYKGKRPFNPHKKKG